MIGKSAAAAKSGGTHWQMDTALASIAINKQCFTTGE